MDNKVIWQAVAQLKCYRDGVLFGNGTGGCRWDGHTRVEVIDYGLFNMADMCTARRKAAA